MFIISLVEPISVPCYGARDARNIFFTVLPLWYFIGSVVNRRFLKSHFVIINFILVKKCLEIHWRKQWHSLGLTVLENYLMELSENMLRICYWESVQSFGVFSSLRIFSKNASKARRVSWNESVKNMGALRAA